MILEFVRIEDYCIFNRKKKKGRLESIFNKKKKKG